MKKLVLLLLALVVVWGGTAWAGKDELRIYIWAEYMDEAVMTKEFETKFGIKVRIDHFESVEEMMAKLQSGGANQYDLVCLNDYVMEAALSMNMVQKLDHSKIPNLKNLMPRFYNDYYDPGCNYHVPFQWGFTGMLYRKDKIAAKDAQSWSLVFDPNKLQGPFYLLDSQQEMISLTMNYLGYDPNSYKTDQLKAAIDLLVKTKKRSTCLGFKGGVGARDEVASGTAQVSIVYNGDALRVVGENPQSLGFTVPKEGTFMFLDNLSMTKNAPNPEAAYKWLNWMLEPKIGAAISNYCQYATPNKASIPYINKEDLNNSSIYPSKEVMDRLFYLKDPGANMKLLDQAWTRIKAQ
jgi:spermidine/putrescine transport system substrate-binding protein